MLGRIQQTDLSVPYRLRGYLYFTRTEEGRQYSIHFRKRDTETPKIPPATPPPMRPPPSTNSSSISTSSPKATRFSASARSMSATTTNLLAYSLDITGFRQYTLHVKNLRLP